LIYSFSLFNFYVSKKKKEVVFKEEILLKKKQKEVKKEKKRERKNTKRGKERRGDYIRTRRLDRPSRGVSINKSCQSLIPGTSVKNKPRIRFFILITQKGMDQRSTLILH
jgi:hypothetical protein